MGLFLCAQHGRIRQLVHELQRITLESVSGTAASRLWNEYIARYHYLGYTPMSGSQIRYNVFAGDQLVVCVSFCGCPGLNPPLITAKDIWLYPFRKNVVAVLCL